MNYQISLDHIDQFQMYLMENECSPKTVEKYIRDVHAFYRWLPEDKRVIKELVVAYKNEIVKNYAVSSVNSMLAAVNRFLQFLDHPEFVVKTIKRQREIFCAKEKELSKEEYVRLLKAAALRGNKQLNLIMQTICSTGIRVSELEYITVEALRYGRVEVESKGKRRTVFLPKALVVRLNLYIKENGITTGPVFVTRSGNPLDRGNIWAAMKKLCVDAGVEATKVFPHNLRHLFARQFYRMEKDIARLADILGHSSIDTTRIYMMSTGYEHIKKIERLGLVI